ncbi:MAG: hypothetical protein SNH27_05025 [Rikenellaceae bacterium]
MTAMIVGGGIWGSLIGGGWMVALWALIGLCGFWAIMIALRGEEEVWVENDLLPFPGYQCINLCGYVLYNGTLTEVDKNHEKTHTAQMKVLLYIGFYIWYSIEWAYQGVWWIFDKEMKAYYYITMEQEAYKYESNSSYLSTRAKFAFLEFIGKWEKY